MRIAYHVMSAPSPLGLLFAAATERGLRYLEYMDRRSLKRTIEAHAVENPETTWEPSVRELRPLADQLEQYFCGTLRAFDVRLDPVGNEQQQRIWQALSAIPYGETRTYGDVARAVGQPGWARLVGQAANQNPIMIVVPCHRVVGADGKLVGYVGGLARKKALLALETRFRGLPDPDGDHVIEQLVVKVERPAPERRVSGNGRSRPRPKAARAPASRRAAAPRRSPSGGRSR